jgi:hypothetical protein
MQGERIKNSVKSGKHDINYAGIIKIGREETLRLCGFAWDNCGMRD